MNRELIKKRVDEHQKELDVWTDTIRKINSGELTNSLPLIEFVSKNIYVYTNKIEELEWVLENAE